MAFFFVVLVIRTPHVQPHVNPRRSGRAEVFGVGGGLDLGVDDRFPARFLLRGLDVVEFVETILSSRSAPLEESSGIWHSFGELDEARRKYFHGKRLSNRFDS
jgi:hypothetical protein